MARQLPLGRLVRMLEPFVGTASTMACASILTGTGGFPSLSTVLTVSFRLQGQFETYYGQDEVCFE